MLPITARVRDKQSFHVARPQTHAVVCLCFAKRLESTEISSLSSTELGNQHVKRSSCQRRDILSQVYAFYAKQYKLREKRKSHLVSLFCVSHSIVILGSH